MMRVHKRLLAGIIMLCVSIADAAPLETAPQPQDCQVMGSQSRIDFGTHNRANLAINTRGKLTLGQRSLRINVVCRFPQKMVLSIAGALDGQQFGWGNDAEVRIAVQDAELDNKPIRLSRLQRDGHTAVDAAPILTLFPGDYFTPLAEIGEITGKQLMFTLTAEPELDDSRVTFNRPYNGRSLIILRLE